MHHLPRFHDSLSLSVPSLACDLWTRSIARRADDLHPTNHRLTHHRSTIVRTLFSQTNFTTLTGRKCKLAQQSVNGGRGNTRGPGASDAQHRLAVPCAGPAPEWVAFSDLTQGRSTFMMNESSAVDPVAVVLLCASVDLDGPFMGDEGEGPYMVLSVDGWVKYRVSPDFAEAFCALRGRVRRAFEHYVTTAGRGSHGGAAEGMMPADLMDALRTTVRVLASGDMRGTAKGGGGASKAGVGGYEQPKGKQQQQQQQQQQRQRGNGKGGKGSAGSKKKRGGGANGSGNVNRN